MNRARRLLLRVVAGATVGALAGFAVAQSAPPATAATGSAVTVSGRGEFKDMRFTAGEECFNGELPTRMPHVSRNKALAAFWTTPEWP